MVRIVPAALLMLLAGAAQAHDFWIEPSSFRPQPGAVVSIGLRLGQDFIGDPVPRVSRSIAQFVLRQNGADEPIGGADNIDPAGFIRADAQATALIGYRSNGAAVELPADRFEDYLRQYGLDEALAERTRRGEREKPGRERFFRYAKALLTGAAPSSDATRPLGFAYEIVPDADPTARFAPLHGRVLYEGAPLKDAQVVAYPHGAPATRLTVRTDAAGAFTLALPKGGVWLIASVHMVRGGFFSGTDWESHWASLTFAMPEAAP